MPEEQRRPSPVAPGAGPRVLDDETGRVVAMAAHDLRSPLCAVTSIARLLLDEPELGESARREFLEAILRTCDSAQHLVTRLLDLSRLELGHLDLRLRRVEIQRFASQFTQLTRPLCKSKGIDLTVAVDCAQADYLFDPDVIGQVLTDLISNAAKFSRPGTTIRWQVRSARELEFEVADEGQGIHAEELPGLFREFQQTSTRATGGERGAGLGLAICQRLITLHGGQIGAESTLGRGSRFWFTVPVAAIPLHDAPCRNSSTQRVEPPC